MVRFGGLFFLTLTVTGCAVSPDRPAWPEDLPPLSYYESLYAEDTRNRQFQSRQEFLKWVKAFYAGWGGVPGWRSIRDEILADVDASTRARMRNELNELGKKLSGEWAKSYEQRLIDTRTAQVWINAAYEAGTHRDHERLLEEIISDVEALLEGRMNPSAITLKRYYPDAKAPSVPGGITVDTKK